jgi:hypothetical protein
LRALAHRARAVANPSLGAELPRPSEKLPPQLLIPMRGTRSG